MHWCAVVSLDLDKRILLVAAFIVKTRYYEAASGKRTLISQLWNKELDLVVAVYIRHLLSMIRKAERFKEAQ
jgi:hypothetical protein